MCVLKICKNNAIIRLNYRFLTKPLSKRQILPKPTITLAACCSMLKTLVKEVMFVISSLNASRLASKFLKRHTDTEYIRKQKCRKLQSSNVHRDIFSLKSVENQNIQSRLQKQQFYKKRVCSKTRPLAITDSMAKVAFKN